MATQEHPPALPPAPVVERPRWSYKSVAALLLPVPEFLFSALVAATLSQVTGREVAFPIGFALMAALGVLSGVLGWLGMKDIITDDRADRGKWFATFGITASLILVIIALWAFVRTIRGYL